MALQPADLKEKLDSQFRAQLEKLEAEIDEGLKKHYNGGPYRHKTWACNTEPEVLDELRKRYHGWTVSKDTSKWDDCTTYYIVFKAKSRP